MAGMTLEDAERMLQAAKNKALEMGVRLSISVVDDRGRPQVHGADGWSALAHSLCFPGQG